MVPLCHGSNISALEAEPRDSVSVFLCPEDQTINCLHLAWKQMLITTNAETSAILAVPDTRYWRTFMATTTFLQAVGFTLDNNESESYDELALCHLHRVRCAKSPSGRTANAYISGADFEARCECDYARCPSHPFAWASYGELSCNVIRDLVRYKQAIGEGATGRLLHISEILTIWFQGNGKFKYAQELLEFQITRLAEWTPAAEYPYKNNCLLSIHGDRFAPVDQIDEGFNDDIKVAYNPRGNMQSKEYQKTHIVRSLMTFRAIREAMQRSSGAQSYGHSHSEVDASGDISRVVE